MRIPEYELKSGHSMPVLGLGTWQLTGEDCERTVRQALEIGYTQIDTSDDYMNEETIGKALKGFDRSNLFITSKVDDSKLREQQVIDACRGSLERLGIEYLDLYLIHRPNPTVPLEETMEGMEELVEREMVRSIGISNFSIEGTKSASEASFLPLSNNQIKIHPYHYPKDAIEFFKARSFVVTAYSPLDTGGIVSDDLLTGIGERHGKSAAQVSLRWLLQKGLVVIPKSSSREHLEENIDIFDWKLSEEDSRKIDDVAMKALRG